MAASPWCAPAHAAYAACFVRSYLAVLLAFACVVWQRLLDQRLRSIVLKGVMSGALQVCLHRCYGCPSANTDSCNMFCRGMGGKLLRLLPVLCR